MSTKAIVLDANILVRAILGKRARALILGNVGTVRFFAPAVAYEDARRHLPSLLEKRGIDSVAALKVLEALEAFVIPIAPEYYADFRAEATKRIAVRDADDWPVLACALSLGCPVWTEDADFFGSGVATWTTDRVQLYFSAEIAKK